MKHPCPHCTRKTWTRAGLADHISTAHPTVQPRLTAAATAYPFGYVPDTVYQPSDQDHDGIPDVVEKNLERPFDYEEPVREVEYGGGESGGAGASGSWEGEQPGGDTVYTEHNGDQPVADQPAAIEEDRTTYSPSYDTSTSESTYSTDSDYGSSSSSDSGSPSSSD